MNRLFSKPTFWFLPRLRRESIYQILSQTTPENTSKNYADYSINPRTRYTRVNLTSISTSQVRRTEIFYFPNTGWGKSYFNPSEVRIIVLQEPSHWNDLSKVFCSDANNKSISKKKRRKMLFVDFFFFMKVQHLYDVDKSNQPSKKLKNRLLPTHQGQLLTYFLLLYSAGLSRPGEKENTEKKKLLPCLRLHFCFCPFRFIQWFWGVVEMVPEAHSRLRECESKWSDPVLEVRAGSVCSDPPLQTSPHVRGSFDTNETLRVALCSLIVVPLYCWPSSLKSPEFSLL